MHAQTSERLNVRVAVVQRVHEGEQGLEVQQAVREVEVNCVWE